MNIELAEIILGAPLFGPKRKPLSRQDFGGDDTVGLKVRRMGKRNLLDYVDHDFGMFLGFQKGKYHIGTCEVTSFKPSKLESFDTLEELKMKWELD